jgi:hypothetical protein
MHYKYNYVELYIHGCFDLLEEATHWGHFLMALYYVRLIIPVATGS